MNYIPGGRLIKKYLYRFIAGLLLLPIPPLILLMNEWIATGNMPSPFENEFPGIYWIIRVMCYVFSMMTVYMMISGIKLFMSRIPLSYNEIRNGLRVTSILIGGCICSLSVAVIWFLHKPLLGCIPLALALACLIVWLIRSVPQKANFKTTSSVKPHSSKDV